VSLREQNRRGASRIERQEAFTPFPGPFLDEPQIETVLAEYEPDKARMRTERMVEQRVHAALDDEPLNMGRAAPQAKANGGFGTLAKLAPEATGVLRFLRLRRACE
jgi:hypothetical protein